MIFAFFRASGYSPYSKHLLKILLRYGEIIVDKTLRNLTGIFSGPGALLGLSCCICARTSSSVIESKAKDLVKLGKENFFAVLGILESILGRIVVKYSFNKSDILALSVTLQLKSSAINGTQLCFFFL